MLFPKKKNNCLQHKSVDGREDCDTNLTVAKKGKKKEKTNSPVEKGSRFSRQLKGNQKRGSGSTSSGKRCRKGETFSGRLWTGHYFNNEKLTSCVTKNCKKKQAG